MVARDGRFLVASFHPELTDDTRLHDLFLDTVRAARGVGEPHLRLAAGREALDEPALDTRRAVGGLLRGFGVFTDLGTYMKNRAYYTIYPGAGGATTWPVRGLGLVGAAISLALAVVAAWDLAWYLWLVVAGWLGLGLLLWSRRRAERRRHVRHVERVGAEGGLPVDVVPGLQEVEEVREAGHRAEGPEVPQRLRRPPVEREPAAGCQHGHPVAQGVDHVHLVRDEQDGQTQAAADVAQQRQDLFRRFRVQR